MKKKKKRANERKEDQRLTSGSPFPKKAEDQENKGWTWTGLVKGFGPDSLRANAKAMDHRSLQPIQVLPCPFNKEIHLII